LEKLAAATNYKFARDQLRSGHYSPQAQFQWEAEGRAMRALSLKVLSGEQAIRIKPSE
jgi:hypothetical protein